MQVQSINNSNTILFGSKKYLDKQTYGYLKELLPRINKQAVYVSNDTNYKSSFLKELHVDDFTLIDGRTLLKQVPENEQLQKETLIEIGRTQLVINNSNGEIIEYNKPVLTLWSRLLGKVSYYIKLVSENFENTALVKRTRLNSNGLTEKGRIEKEKLDVEFARLEKEILNS